MATNIAWVNIIDPLERLFRTAFGSDLRLYFQDRYETRGSAFVAIRLLSDTQIAREGNAATYEYAFELRYYRRLAKAAGDPTGLKAMVADVENIKHMIGENRSYAPSGVYKWHEAKIGEVNYAPEPTELEAQESDLRIVTLALTIAVTAAI